MNWILLIRYCLIATALLTAFGLLVSYTFSTNTGIVVNLVQQYSVQTSANFADPNSLEQQGGKNTIQKKFKFISTSGNGSAIDKSTDQPLITEPADQPLITKPVIDQPLITKSEIDQPLTSKPVIDQPLITKSLIDQPQITKSEIDQPLITKSLIDQPQITKPVIDQPLITKPVIDQPLITKPVIDQPLISKPVIDQPLTSKPVIDQPLISKPVINQPLITKPVIDQPLTSKPVIDQPLISKPVIDQPLIIKPVIDQPLITKSEIDQPLITKSEIDQPLITKSEIDQPLITKSEIDQPQITKPVIDQPLTSKSEIGQPLISKSEIDQPLISKPVIDQPLIIKPVIDQPLITKPVLDQPLITKSVIDQPLITKPVLDQPLINKSPIDNQPDQSISSTTSPPEDTADEKVELACKRPQILVDDPLIKPYLKHFDPMKCNEEPNWVYSRDGRFYISDEAVARHGDISCTYWRFDRIDDDHFNEVNLGPYKNGTLLDADIFYPQCKAADGAKYENLHAAVPIPTGDLALRLKVARKQRAETKKGLNMNIFVYLMDSVSRVNFMRKLPDLYKLLTEEMNAYVMEGFNIVGDGTPWALIPMTTGHFQYELYEARRRFDNASYLDNWPLIYKNFTEAGYVTSFAEEMVWFTAYNYKLKGFSKQPVDHYWRTFLAAREKYKKNHKPYCLGDTPVSIIWLQLWKELQDVYRRFDGRQFSILFSSENSHDDYNQVQVLDTHWVKHFGDLYRNNYLNDTILIIMGDHGRRFGAVRQTQTGKLEEKLPFLSVVVPPWFKEKYPRSDANLRKNRNRLVTVFDLYETFLDVINFEQDGGKGNLSNRGISILKEIPAERTCADADIKAHFCSCLDWTEIRDLQNETVLAAANTIVRYFNDKIQVAGGLCSNLSVAKMISARLLKPNDKLMQFKESIDFDNYTPNLSGDKDLQSVTYQVRFLTEPGGGDWEASLTYFIDKQEFGMTRSDISRLNSYDSQFQCIKKTYEQLREFCYCSK